MRVSLHTRTGLVILLGLVLLITACAQVAPQPVATAQDLNLGCLMPFTGPAAEWGKLIRPQMDIYADLINEDGGIKVGDNVYKVKLFYVDDSYSPAPGAAGARKLIYDNNVKAILGYFSFGESAVAPVTNAEKVIFITRTGSGVVYDNVTNPYVVFGTPSSENALYQTLGALTAFPEIKTICSTGPAAAKMQAESAFGEVDQMLLEKFGLKSVRVYYPEGTTNFTPYIAQMAEQGVQFISSGGSSLEVALLAKQRYAAGYKWPKTQTCTLTSVALFNQLCGSPEAAENIVSDRPAPWEFTKVKVSPAYLDMAQRIRDRFKQTYNQPLTYVGSFGWGINHMAQYFEAIKKAGTLDPDKVMSAFRGGTFDTFMGTYTLSGDEVYGGKIVFGYPCSMGIIKGNEEVHLGEFPMMDVNNWNKPWVK